MKLYSSRIDGSVHRVWERAETTNEAWAFWIPANSSVREASGMEWSSDYSVVGLFWPQRFYQVFLLLKEEQTDYYCNVISPPTYAPSVEHSVEHIEFVDLDLDVLQMEGKLWVADEDEFAVRSSSYPQLWIREAELAKRRLLQEARSKTGPFSLRTAQKWRSWVSRSE